MCETGKSRYSFSKEIPRFCQTNKPGRKRVLFFLVNIVSIKSTFPLKLNWLTSKELAIEF